MLDSPLSNSSSKDHHQQYYFILRWGCYPVFQITLKGRNFKKDFWGSTDLGLSKAPHGFRLTCRVRSPDLSRFWPESPLPLDWETGTKASLSTSLFLRIRGWRSSHFHLCIGWQVRKLHCLVRRRRGSGVMPCNSWLPPLPPLAWIASWSVMSVRMVRVWERRGRCLAWRSWCSRCLKQEKSLG